MRYVMSSKWSMIEHFVIADEAGTPVFDVRGNLGLSQRLSIRDQSGQELAEIKKSLITTKHEILVGGQHVADVRHEGIFGEHYEIDSGLGQLAAKGSFGGWDYTISRGGQTIATISRHLSFREKFTVDVAPGENDVFVLAVVLAIDAIHDERTDRGRSGFGGGLLGGSDGFG